MKSTGLTKLFNRTRIIVSCFAFISIMFSVVPAHAQTALQFLPTNHVPQAVTNGQAQLIGTASQTKLMHVDIMLPLRNQADLTALLNRLYDPNGPDYGHFLSVAQFTERYGPTVQDYQAVVDWAQSKGFIVGDQPANRLLVPITGSVAQINAAFNVTMNAYQHPTENRTFFAPDREPSVDLSVPLWHIAGLSNYSVPHPLVTMPNAGQATANIIGSGPGTTSYIPSDMRAAYYGTGTALTGSGQCVGLAEFDGYEISDVVGTLYNPASYTTNGSNYILTYNPPGGGGPYTIPINNVLVDGGSVTPDPNAPSPTV
ncbi:MAG: protease pro-enzyme activation domain-containing protein [Acidobacteriaceae bacterium]